MTEIRFWDLAIHAKRNNSLQENGFVATIHSNSGLEHSLAENSIQLNRSDVGDRNVFALMQEKNFNWGGESSGHIICSNYLNTGDGLFSALSVLECIMSTRREITTLAKQINLWPSRATALSVNKKKPISSFKDLTYYLKEKRSSHKESFRTLIRYSGTEPKIRILVEAQEEELMNEVFYKVNELIKNHV